jgi:hypothetical protein
MSQSHALLRFLRKLHLYLGVFTAPALLFFALTGAMQTFSLHETTQGSSYKPPAWIASLAQLHKKQTAVVPMRRPRPESGPALAPPDPTPEPPATLQSLADPAPRPKSHLPMKIFFLLVSLGLFLSTLTGLYMAYRYSRGRLLITGLLFAGVILPLLMLPL